MLRRDMPDVLTIERESFPSPWTEAEFIRALRQRNAIGRVVEVGVRVVAFCVYELFCDRLEILNFAVAAEFRRRGVGSFLIDQLAAKLGPQRRNRILAEPKLVRTFGLIDPRNDTTHSILPRTTLAVECVDADRRGVTVRNFNGVLVSLHPSEFEVLEFA